MSGSTADQGLFHRITGVSFQEVNKKIGDSLRPLPNMKPVCEQLAIELRTKEEIKRLAAESNTELKKQQDMLVDISWKHGVNNTAFVLQTAVHGAAGAAASLTYIDDFDPTDSDYDTTKGYQICRAELQQMTEVAHEKIAACARKNESLQEMAAKRTPIFTVCS